MNCSAFPWYWECTWKNPLFQACYGLALEFRILTIKFLGYSISGISDILYVIKDYFNSAQGHHNNKPSQQVNVGPNWNRMSFPKLPYLLDALWSIIATPDHFPVFRNKKESETAIEPFVVTLYLFRVCNQWCMHFMSVVFSYFCLLLQSVWLMYLFINCTIANHI